MMNDEQDGMGTAGELAIDNYEGGGLVLDDCLFCKIIAREIPSQAVYEDEFVFAFRDIAPKAPVHVLVVPKEHIESAAVIDAGNSHVAARCFEAISKIAESEGLAKGFRVISNSGPDGGQTVFHLHFHILGGKAMGPGLV